jgi:D-cysteine desulfhydrase/L-cysteate sulfo-lyase
LKAHPRAPLFETPTVLEDLKNLGGQLGIELTVKRDDCLPLAMGGNKVRQLEYYFGQAIQQEADTVLITGAVQSNFVRLCAAAARKFGMTPICQLECRVSKDDVFYNASGNVLLLNVLGAEIVHFSEGENEAAADASLDIIAQKKQSEGFNPYVIHLGLNHAPIGGLGYAAAAVETLMQYNNRGDLPDYVVIPSGSGLTHAGFLAGARAIGWDVPVLGICVRREARLQRQRIHKRAIEIAAMLTNKLLISEADIQLDDNNLAPGYGQMNDQVAEAIQLAAKTEALLLDPVYCGRTIAGLINHVRNGSI